MSRNSDLHFDSRPTTARRAGARRPLRALLGPSLDAVPFEVGDERRVPSEQVQRAAKVALGRKKSVDWCGTGSGIDPTK